MLVRVPVRVYASVLGAWNWQQLGIDVAQVTWLVKRGNTWPKKRIKKIAVCPHCVRRRVHMETKIHHGEYNHDSDPDMILTLSPMNQVFHSYSQPVSFLGQFQWLQKEKSSLRWELWLQKNPVYTRRSSNICVPKDAQKAHTVSYISLRAIKRKRCKIQT